MSGYARTALLLMVVFVSGDSSAQQTPDSPDLLPGEWTLWEAPARTSGRFYAPWYLQGDFSAGLPSVAGFEPGAVIRRGANFYILEDGEWKPVAGTFLTGSEGSANDLIVIGEFTLMEGESELFVEFEGWDIPDPANLFYDRKFSGPVVIQISRFGGDYTGYENLQVGATVGSHKGFTLRFPGPADRDITVVAIAKLIPASGVRWADLSRGEDIWKRPDERTNRLGQSWARLQ